MDQTQLVFVDTPGFLQTASARKERLLQDLMDSAANEMQHTDYTLVVVDAAKRVTDSDKETLAELMLKARFSSGRVEAVLDDQDEDEKETQTLEKFAIVLNKVDLVDPKRKLLVLAEELGLLAEEVYLYRGEDKKGDNQKDSDKPMDPELLAQMFPPIFYVSALEDDGVDDVLRYLLDRATPSRAWAVEAGKPTEMTNVERVEEVIREKVYRCLHREVPHHVTQINRSFQLLTHRETRQRARPDPPRTRRSHQKPPQTRVGKRRSDTETNPRLGGPGFGKNLWVLGDSRFERQTRQIQTPHATGCDRVRNRYGGETLKVETTL